MASPWDLSGLLRMTSHCCRIAVVCMVGAVFATASAEAQPFPAENFGDTTDIPVPADYDGDGITDIDVFRPSTGTWFVRNQFNARWGQNGDVPIPLDRDGDGRPELIVYRPSDGTWYSNNPATGLVESVRWGIASDIPVGRGAYWMSR